MQNENEEAKKCCKDGNCGCNGGTCQNPQNPETCKGPCPETANHCKVEIEDEDSLIAAPEGIDAPAPSGDLAKKLEALFTLSKKKAEEKAAEEKELIITGQSNVDTSEFVDVELPNGMTVKVHKDSHKAKQSDMDRLLEAAGGEMDCDIEDDDGNLKDGISIDLEGNIIDKNVDGPAKSEYRPGMLRELKAKFYPGDTAGADAQARLADKDTVEAEVAERFRKQEEGEELATSVDKDDLWKILVQIAQETKVEQERPNSTSNYSTRAPNKRVEKLWRDNPRAMFHIDWDRFSDDDFQRLVNEECKREFKTLKLESGLEVHVPIESGLDQYRLEQIFRAATVEVPDKGGEARAKRTAKLRGAILAERLRAEREEEAKLDAAATKAARIRELTNDIIPISPIENPSSARRAIRSIRRTWKRLTGLPEKVLAWWRL